MHDTSRLLSRILSQEYRILSQEYFPVYQKWSQFGRITVEVCLLALRQPARGKFNRRPEPLGVGIRFITIKNEKH